MLALKIQTSHRLGGEKVWMNIWLVGHLRRGLNCTKIKWQKKLLKIDWTTEFSLEWTWLDCTASACESRAFFMLLFSELWLVWQTSLAEADPCSLLISKVTVLFLMKNSMWTSLTLPCFDKIKNSEVFYCCTNIFPLLGMIWKKNQGKVGKTFQSDSSEHVCSRFICV